MSSPSRRNTCSPTASADAAGRVDHVDVGELAHPRELAARVVAGAPLHRLDVAGQQLLEAERLARGHRCTGGVRTEDLAWVRRPRTSHRPGRRFARTAARAPSRGRSAASAGARESSTAPTRRPVARARRRRATRARARSAGESVGSISPPPTGRAARAPCAAPAARVVRARPSSARAPLRAGVAGGCSSVSAARRYRPVPPTTIGRSPVDQEPVDLGVRELRVLPGAESAHRRAGTRSTGARAGPVRCAPARPVSSSSPEYT